jgi:hypothetical protein
MKVLSCIAALGLATLLLIACSIPSAAEHRRDNKERRAG